MPLAMQAGDPGSFQFCIEIEVGQVRAEDKEEWETKFLRVHDRVF